MKYVQTCFAWMTTFSLIIGPLGLEGCSSKGSDPAAATQQSPPAQGQPAAAAAPDATQQASQQQPASQAQPINLPDVNLTPAGLDELLAPIALYPDPVLAVMLQASVDPQQVMDGGNWLALDQNNSLKEAALDEASKQAGFTPVMQALLHYPTVMDLMCTQFDWTKQLGAAYQADPKTVLDSVQRLRATAVDNGALKSGPQMKVDVTKQNGQQVVQLEPTEPEGSLCAPVRPAAGIQYNDDDNQYVMARQRRRPQQVAQRRRQPLLPTHDRGGEREIGRQHRNSRSDRTAFFWGGNGSRGCH